MEPVWGLTGFIGASLVRTPRLSAARTGSIGSGTRQATDTTRAYAGAIYRISSSARFNSTLQRARKRCTSTEATYAITSSATDAGRPIAGLSSTEPRDHLPREAQQALAVEARPLGQHELLHPGLRERPHLPPDLLHRAAEQRARGLLRSP